MQIIKHGKHRLFETDGETSCVVSEMLSDLERNGMDAVRKYSQVRVKRYASATAT